MTINLNNWNIHEKMGNNKIKTSTYTIYDFLPFNLFHQVSKPANIFFIILTCL